MVTVSDSIFITKLWTPTHTTTMEWLKIMMGRASLPDADSMAQQVARAKEEQEREDKLERERRTARYRNTAYSKILYCRDKGYTTCIVAEAYVDLYSNTPKGRSEAEQLLQDLRNQRYNCKIDTTECPDNWASTSLPREHIICNLSAPLAQSEPA